MGGRVLNKHRLNTVTLHRRWGPMMSMCSAGLRESAWQRKATPHCVQLSFVASCTESQTQEFCALFSSSPAFVPSTWAIVWLSCEVSVSPWSSFSAIYVSQWTFLLRFEEAECSMVGTLTALHLFLHPWLPSGKDVADPKVIHTDWGKESVLCSSSQKERMLQEIRP